MYAIRSYYGTNKIVNQGLLNILDLPDSVQVIAASPLFYLKNLNELEFFLSHAQEHNLQLKKIEHKIELANLKLKSEKADYLSYNFV